MTLCKRCGIEIRTVVNGAGVGYGHVAPTAFRHYPRPAARSAADSLSARREGSAAVRAADAAVGRSGDSGSVRIGTPRRAATAR